MPIEATIVRLKREYPGWGAPKIRGRLRQRLPTLPPLSHCPALSTVHGRARPMGSSIDADGAGERPAQPCRSRPSRNALCCVDYKGEFMLGNRRICHPLTITDCASRYLLTCEALSTAQETFAFTI